MNDPEREVLGKVAREMLAGETHIDVHGEAVMIKRTTAQHLRTASFRVDGRSYTAVEQNPEKPSRWGELARSGHSVVQFKDALTNRFVAVAVDGKVMEYGRSRH